MRRSRRLYLYKAPWHVCGAVLNPADGQPAGVAHRGRGAGALDRATKPATPAFPVALTLLDPGLWTHHRSGASRTRSLRRWRGCGRIPAT